MEDTLIPNIYIGERDFKKIEWDLEIEYWYRDEILSRIWDSKPNHTGIILWPRLDSEFKKSEKFTTISNQDNSKIQEVYKVFFDTEINNENSTYLFFPLNSILIKENDITEDLLSVLKGIKLSFDENKVLKIQSNFNINKFTEEE